MIGNVNEFLGTVARSDLGKAARRSARTIWNAHRAAFETTREEAGKVFGLAVEQGQKLNERGRGTVERVVGNLAGEADERISSIEKAMQQRASRVIRRIGLPTADEVKALSRRVDALSAKARVRVPKRASRRKKSRAA